MIPFMTNFAGFIICKTLVLYGYVHIAIEMIFLLWVIPFCVI